MKRIITFIENIFNDWSIMKKLVFLYVFCVIVPLIVTDSVILSLLIKGQERERQLEYDNITTAIQMEMEYAVNEASQVINNIYVKRDIYDFIGHPFENAYDYYDHILNIYKTVPIDMFYSSNISNVVIYADNPSIINGGHFSRLERAKPYAWYEKLIESEDQMILDYHYVGDREPWSTAKRRVSLVRFMNYEKSSEREKIICVDIDYSKLAKRIINLNYGHPIYVCRDGRVLITNDGHYASDQQYQILEKDETYAATRTFSLLKEDYQVIFMQSGDSITDILMKNRWILFFLLSFNLILPLGMVLTQ